MNKYSQITANHDLILLIVYFYAASLCRIEETSSILVQIEVVGRLNPTTVSTAMRKKRHEDRVIPYTSYHILSQCTGFSKQ